MADELLTTSLTEDGRDHLLVQAVVDYAIYMLDRDGMVRSWNAGAQRCKGYEAAEIVGLHFSRFYTEEDRRAGLPERALATAATAGRFESEGWRVRKDGSRFWAHVVIDPVRLPCGELVGFAKVTRDLTERKIAEQALKQSEERFRLLVQAVSDYAIFMLDPDGHVSNWNVGAERIKGYRPEEIIGAHFSRFYAEEDRLNGEPEKALATAVGEGRFEKEGWRVRKDGSRFRANVVIQPIRDDTGAVLGFAKVTRDVTEAREAQQALEQAREALFQAQKMEAIGQLTGGVAHDFNNLLMAILGSLQLVRKRLAEDPRVTPHIDNAMRAAERGSSLTRRMLAFARRQELTPEPVDIPSLVRGMAGLLQRSLGPSVLVETRFPIALDMALVDANQLELALLNLAVNARDAMPSGGPLIIGAREESLSPDNAVQLSPGKYIRLSVTDAGEGMDEATLPRATDPFFTTKGVGKGTGLGLSMVHGLAEQSGGRLVLRSRKGEGTTAEIWLPVAAGAAPERAKAVEDAAEPSPPVGTRPLVVLAVDDDGLVLMNTAAMLEDLGHRALEATSGEQALDILRRGLAVDVVITDQAMPHMTGLQLAEAIRREWPALPVVLATGYAELPHGVDLRRLGKPFSQQELARVVHEAGNPGHAA